MNLKKMERKEWNMCQILLLEMQISNIYAPSLMNTKSCKIHSNSLNGILYENVLHCVPLHTSSSVLIYHEDRTLLHPFATQWEKGSHNKTKEKSDIISADVNTFPWLRSILNPAGKFILGDVEALQTCCILYRRCY
jgi:hypothetical protein